MTTTATQVRPRTHHPKKQPTQRQLEAASKKKAERLVAFWAKAYMAYHLHDVASIVNRGEAFNDGKEALGHGNWLDALEEAGIAERTAQYYMRIANHPVLVESANFALLPSTASALHFLAGLQEEFVQALLDEQRIGPNTTVGELVEMIEPAPAEPPVKPAPKKSGKKVKELTWPTSVDASVKSFFGGAFDCDTTFPGEAVWSRDDEAVAFMAAPATDTAVFHNRLIGGEVALFPLGQRFAMFYKGERRDQFASEFGYLGTLVVAWGA